MANRSFVRNTMSLEKNPVSLYAKINIGATGAPSPVAKQCLGFASVVRTGTGAYTLNLGLSSASVDTYQRLLDIDIAGLNSTAPAWASAYVVQDNSANLSAPNVKIQLLDKAGAAVDPASGEVLLINLVLSNSTAI